MTTVVVVGGGGRVRGHGGGVHRIRLHLCAHLFVAV